LDFAATTVSEPGTEARSRLLWKPDSGTEQIVPNSALIPVMKN
jgi:hypothetical protein